MTVLRHEEFIDGVCVRAEVVDLEAGTVTFEEDGKVVGSRVLTDDERRRNEPPPPPLEERLAELEREVRGMKERAAAAQVAGDARKVRDAVVGD